MACCESLTVLSGPSIGLGPEEALLLVQRRRMVLNQLCDFFKCVLVLWFFESLDTEFLSPNPQSYTIHAGTAVGGLGATITTCRLRSLNSQLGGHSFDRFHGGSLMLFDKALVFCY